MTPKWAIDYLFMYMTQLLPSNSYGYVGYKKQDLKKTRKKPLNLLTTKLLQKWTWLTPQGTWPKLCQVILLMFRVMKITQLTSAIVYLFKYMVYLLPSNRFWLRGVQNTTAGKKNSRPTTNQLIFQLIQRGL